MAGVMFTADPVTSNRKVVSVEATFGLGEAAAQQLLDDGHDIVLHARNRERAAAIDRLARRAVGVRPGDLPDTH